MTEAHGLH